MPTPADRPAQRCFDWLVPFQSKALLTSQEVALCIGRGQTFVRELVEAGRLEAFGDSATGERETLRVTRRSVVAYLASTARSDPADHAQTVQRLELPLPQRVRLYRALAKTCVPHSAAALP